MIAERIKKLIGDALKEVGISDIEIGLEHPADMAHGDYATNAALLASKESDKNSQELAEKIVGVLQKAEGDFNFLEKVEIAGPGFINFFLSRSFFTESAREIIEKGETFGTHERLSGTGIFIEHTQPNPFKDFHIGHLMNNTIGEALSRLYRNAGAEVTTATFHGDVGLHVAQAIYGKLTNPHALWGEAYTIGNRAYETHKEEIDALNKKIYERRDDTITALYDQGREETLDAFKKIYTRLGSSFDYHFFESEAGPVGVQVVRDHCGTIFTESEGAVVFPGEEYGLHTRVFITSQGLPTYEAKDVGLITLKQQKKPHDSYIVVTANEQNEYFKVVIKAIESVYPELVGKVTQVGHGMLRLPHGKMSSREGTVITAESLLGDVKEKVVAKMETADPDVVEQIAIGAVKYSILKQTIGKDILFDIDTSLSLDGDSGPYLQYTYARALSVLEKASSEGVGRSISALPPSVTIMERLLYRFPEITDRSVLEHAPHYVVTYLTELASTFNTWYAQEKIVDTKDQTSPYRVLLTAAVAVVLKNGLSLLAIPAPRKM